MMNKLLPTAFQRYQRHSIHCKFQNCPKRITDGVRFHKKRTSYSVGSIWGIVGVVALLLSAVWRLTPAALEPILESLSYMVADAALWGLGGRKRIC